MYYTVSCLLLLWSIWMFYELQAFPHVLREYYEQTITTLMVILESVCQGNLVEKCVLWPRVLASMAEGCNIMETSLWGKWAVRTSFVVLHRDGKTLASGGRSNLLHLWCLESRQLMRVVQMPPRVRTVRHLEFLSDSFDGGSSQVLLPFFIIKHRVKM